MQIESTVLLGVLFGVAVWLVLHRSFVRIIFGFILMSHAANLLILLSSGDPSGKHPPVVNGSAPLVDPLPQALILTAIVIGFGVIAYMAVLLYRLFLDFRASSTTQLYGEEPEEREKSK